MMHVIENGRELGKPIPFYGTDIEKLIRLDEMDAKNRKKAR